MKIGKFQKIFTFAAVILQNIQLVTKVFTKFL